MGGKKKQTSASGRSSGSGVNRGGGGSGASCGGSSASGDGGAAAGGSIPTVFWDVDNLALSNKFDFTKITQVMAKSLTEAKIGVDCSDVMLYAYGDKHNWCKNFRKDILKSNRSAMVQHVPSEYADACDMSLMSRMQIWAAENRPPATVVLISGDSDFLNVTSFLRQVGYFVVVVCPKGRATLRLQSVPDCVLDWSCFARGEGKEEIFIHKPRVPSAPFQPGSLDSRPISVFWDYKTCPLPEEYTSGKKNVYEIFHSLFKRLNFVGMITITVYAKADTIDRDLKVQLQDEHIYLRDIPDGKYNASKLILVDVGAMIFHSPKNVFTIISNSNLSHLVMNLMTNEKLKQDNTVIVAQTSNERVEYGEAWDWDWPGLLNGDLPPRAPSK